MILEELQIQSFLRLGYFIDYSGQRAPIDFSRINRHLYSSASREDLIRIGVEKLRETFAGLWQPNREHVVPLSGGLDSRIILGALLEHIEASRLHTFTYGIAGSYDYELGNAIAKEYGTLHSAMPLNDETYTLNEELSVAHRTDCQGVLFHHPPLWKLDRLYPGALFWSGFVGDAVAGSHLHDPPSVTLEDAKRLHLINRTFVKSIQLYRCQDEELLRCMGGGKMAKEILTWDEQVLFDEAVIKFTAPLVLFRGYEFATPFINTPWMDFMFSVPNSFRLRQNLMIDIGRRAFPRLFTMPSKNRLGYTFDTPDVVVKATFWLNRARKLAHQFAPWLNYPSVQYNDFNEAIRTSPDFRRIVAGAIERLKKRGICEWIDFDGIWRRHDWRIRNHGDALVVLASLELVIEASESTSKVSSQKE